MTNYLIRIYVIIGSPLLRNIHLLDLIHTFLPFQTFLIGSGIRISLFCGRLCYHRFDAGFFVFAKILLCATVFAVVAFLGPVLIFVELATTFTSCFISFFNFAATVMSAVGMFVVAIDLVG